MPRHFGRLGFPDPRSWIKREATLSSFMREPRRIQIPGREKILAKGRLIIDVSLIRSHVPLPPQKIRWMTPDRSHDPSSRTAVLELAFHAKGRASPSAQKRARSTWAMMRTRTIRSDRKRIANFLGTI